jgi:hypothetical protein
MATTKQRSAPRKNSSDLKPWEDEVLRELYAQRDAYAAEHGYDLNRLYDDLKVREASSSMRRADPVTADPSQSPGPRTGGTSPP